jgi:hypothetical protein
MGATKQGMLDDMDRDEQDHRHPQVIEDATAMVTPTGAEMCYRRGYYQGFYAAMVAMGKLQEWEVENFFYNKLSAWRRKDHKGEWERPPQIDE